MSVTNQVKIYTFLEKFYLSDIRRNRTPENYLFIKTTRFENGGG